MKSTVLSAGASLILLILLGKFAAFGKDVVISAYYGATSQTDAYFVASSVPGLIFAAFYSTVNLVFLPIYNEKRLLSSVENAGNFASNVINVYVLISLILSIVGVCFAPGIIAIIAPSFDKETARLSVELTRILSISFVFTIAVGTLTTIQLAHKKYYGLHAIPVINNLIIILGLFYFASEFGIYVAAVAGVMGWVIQLPIQKYILGNEFTYKFCLNLKDSSLRKMAWLLVPVFVGVSVDQINILIDTVLGSSLIAGSISALNYSNRLLSFSSGMFVALIATIMYPLFSDYVVNNDMDKLNYSISKTMRALIIVTAPIMVISLVFCSEIVEIVFGRGLFDESAVRLTSNVFKYYSVAIVFVVLREMLNRVFYSLRDVRSPLMISIVTISVNIVLSLMLYRPMGAAGLALATSVSTIVYCMFQFHILEKRIGNGFHVKLHGFIVKIVLAAVVMTSTLYILHMFNYSDGALERFVLGAMIGLASYLTALFALKIPEVTIAAKYLFR